MMKTYWITLIAIFATASHLFALDPDLTAKTPEEVYSVYQKAILDNDLDTYYYCLSEELQKISKDTHKMIMGSKKQNITIQNIKAKESNIDGDTAKVTLAGDNSSGIIGLAKENDVWKINSQEKWGEDAEDAPSSNSDLTSKFSTAGFKAPGANDPKIKRLAWSVLVESDKVLAQAEQSKGILENAQKFKVTTDAATTLKSAQNSEAKLYEELGALREADIRAQEALKNAKAFLDDVEAIQIAFETERENDRKAAEATEIAQRAEADRLQQESEYQLKIEQEIGNARAIHAEMMLLFEQHNYADAYNSLKEKLIGCETKEGKEKIQVLVDRYKLMSELKIYVIDRLNASPYRWGWGSGIAAVDIIGADNKGVKLQGKIIPWTGVSTLQMIKFADHYLKPPEIQGVRLKKLANLNLAATILCFENNQTNKAEEFADKAIEIFPSLDDDLRRLTTPL